MSNNGATKKKSKKEAKKRALRTTSPETKKDGMCAARRNYGAGKGR